MTSPEARQAAWEEFRAKLVAATCYADLSKILSQTPAHDDPGWQYYARLGFFVGTTCPPSGAGPEELRQYVRLVRAFAAQGMLEPDEVETFLWRFDEQLGKAEE